MKRWLTVLFLVALLLMAGGISIAADSPLSLGSLELFPVLSLSATSDDNIHISGTARQHDIITGIKPSLGLKWPGYRHNLALYYSIDLAYFNEHPDENTRKQKASLQYLLGQKEGLHFKMRNHFRRTSGSDSLEVAGRIGRATNELNMGVGFRSSRQTMVEIGGSYTTMRFDDKESYIDRDQIEGIASFGYELRPQVYFSTDYAFGGVNMPDSDYRVRYHQVRLGVDCELRTKLFGTAKIGLQWRNVSNAAQHNFSALTAELIFTYDQTIRRTWKFLIDRRVVESIVQTENAYAQSKFGLSVRQMVGKRFELKLEGNYAYNDFFSFSSESQRMDQVFNGEVEFGYTWNEWVSVGIAYEYKNFASKNAENDNSHTRNRYTFTVRSSL